MKYILDTNALLNNPDFLSDNEVILVPTVLRELENLELKRSNTDMQYRIRSAKRKMIECIENINFFKEVNDEKALTLNHIGYESDYGDNIILSYVLEYKADNPKEEFKVYTDDVLLCLKLDMYSIPFCNSGQLNEENYSGVYEWYYVENDEEHQEILSMLYEDKTCNIFNLKKNEYLEVKRDFDDVLATFKYNGKEYVEVHYKKIKNNTSIIKPRNSRQSLAIDLLLDDDIPVKALTGPAGAGKDALIFNHALQKQQEEGHKIIWIGNSVLAKGTNEIGFLPGTLEEKLKGNFMVLSDILGGELALQYKMQSELISIEYVGNLRSRTFNDCYIIVGEAQNFTIEQLKLIIGRVGENSIIAFNGDDDQSDMVIIL